MLIKIKNTIIFDLDGTLADCSHRVHLVNEKKWDEFFDLCSLDSPIPNVLELYKKLDTTVPDSYYIMCILSGRSDSVRDKTEAWLDQQGIGYDILYMRKHGDHRPDHVVKKEIFLANFKVEDVLCVFDDRDQVVKMWRSLGLTCLQVADGNF